MKIKRFVFSLLFSKSERAIIWNALVFSSHTYKRRGQPNNAKVVDKIIKKSKSIILSKEEEYAFDSEQFVKNISEFVKGMFEYKKTMTEYERRLKMATIVEPLKTFDGLGLQVGTVIDSEKCKVCEYKDSCELYKILSEEEKEEEKKPEEPVKTERTESESK